MAWGGGLVLVGHREAVKGQDRDLFLWWKFDIWLGGPSAGVWAPACGDMRAGGWVRDERLALAKQNTLFSLINAARAKAIMPSALLRLILLWHILILF